MKKYLFIALAAATLASCSQDEVMEVAEKQAISFGNTFVENATRATDPSYNNDDKKVTAFKVWGNVATTTADTFVPVFAGANVVGTEYGVAWTCDVTQYWIYGATYDFAAVVNGTVGSELNNGLPKTISYTANNSDLLYAEEFDVIRQATQSETEKLVKFTFNHLLSKVKFTVSNTTPGTSNDALYTYNIKSLTIKNSKSSGVYTIGGTWGSYGATDSATSFGDIESVGSTSKICNSEMLLIPADFTSTKLQIGFTLEWCFNGEIITSNPKALEASVNLEAGKAYNFTISTGLDKPIQFTVEEVEDWDYDTNDDGKVDADDNIEVETAA